MRASQISRSNTPPLGVSTVAVRAAGAAFNQLRTVEQLGYIVGVFASISEGVGSFGALVTLSSNRCLCDCDRVQKSQRREFFWSLGT